MATKKLIGKWVGKGVIEYTYVIEQENATVYFTDKTRRIYKDVNRVSLEEFINRALWKDEVKKITYKTVKQEEKVREQLHPCGNGAGFYY